MFFYMLMSQKLFYYSYLISKTQTIIIFLSFFFLTFFPLNLLPLISDRQDCVVMAGFSFTVKGLTFFLKNSRDFNSLQIS